MDKFNSAINKVEKVPEASSEAIHKYAEGISFHLLCSRIKPIEFDC